MSEGRECPWVVTVKASTNAFRPLFGLGKNYAGSSDFYCDVQPGELIFHFTDYSAAFLFVVHCIKKQFDVTLRDEGKAEGLQSLEKLPKRERDFSLMEKKTPEMRTYPMRLELAGYYSEDATDFLRRYRLAFYSEEVDFQGVKSRRAKAYVDLRMALEALLKATICLRVSFTLAGRPLVEKIRGYSHRVDQLAVDALKNVRVDSRYRIAIEKCKSAPVDLRYQFDAMNFRIPDDKDYYDTIGSNHWLKLLEEFVEKGIKRLSAALGRRSKVVSGSVVARELSRPSDYPRNK